MGRACCVKQTVKEGQSGQRPERSEGESHFVIRRNSHPVERRKQVSGLGWECAWPGEERPEAGVEEAGGNSMGMGQVGAQVQVTLKPLEGLSREVTPSLTWCLRCPAAWEGRFQGAHLGGYCNNPGEVLEAWICGIGSGEKCSDSGSFKGRILRLWDVDCENK